MRTINLFDYLKNLIMYGDFYGLSFGSDNNNFINAQSQRINAQTQKNIVLDLDETLIHTFNPEDTEDRRSPTKHHHSYATRDFKFLFEDIGYLKEKSSLYLLDVNKLKRKYGYDIEDFNDSLWGFSRPHLKDFLIFCRKYFNKIIVWTAGTAAYGRGICDIIFADLYEPDLILTREDCELGRGRRIHKPLNKLYSMNEFRGILTPQNTLIVDDKKFNFSENKDNGILIHPFDPEPKNIPIREWLRMKDDRLLDLKLWLDDESVRKCKDVRLLNKNQIFG